MEVKNTGKRIERERSDIRLL